MIFARVLYAATLISLVSVSQAEAVTFSAAMSQTDGGISLTVDGSTWFSSAPLEVFVEGRWWSVQSGSLKMVSKQFDVLGHDNLGTFKRSTISWIAGSTQIVTHLRVYESLSAVAIGLVYPQGAANTSLGDSDAVSSKWPHFVNTTGEPLGFTTYSGNMACPGHEPVCTLTSEWNNLGQAAYSLVDGLHGGAPIMFYNQKLATVIASPLTNFMAASFVQDERSHTFAAGLMGSITYAPAGFTLDTIFVAAQGVNEAMRTWGSAVRQFHGKMAIAPGVDHTIDYLGYYTDNGAFYYYNTEPGKNYADTLVDVVAEGKRQKLPYQYLQLDSWWYYKGPRNGVTEWVSMPSVFPDGIKAVQEDIKMRFVAHNRWWSNETVYAKQNGGAYDFILEEKLSIPTSQVFWDDLMANSTTWGLAVYEQDWLHNEFEELTCTMESPTLGRDWLLQMGRAAWNNGVKIQYCMPYPRHVLQSLEIPAVTQIRASDDYSPANDQWSIGVSSMLAHAVGLAPFKDDWWSTDQVQSGSKHPYHADAEPAPELQAMVAVLSTGPVGPSDKIGMANVTNIMRTCATDGKLLKPSVPATAVDTTFAQRAFGVHGPQGELWSTYTQVSGIVSGIVLAALLDAPYSLSPAVDLDIAFPAGATLYAWQDGSSAAPRVVSESNPINFPKMTKLDAQLWHIGAELEDGIVLMGDLTKYVPLAPARFVNIEYDGSDYTLSLVGGPDELVSVSYFETASGTVHTELCTLSGAGQAKLLLKAGECLGF